MAPDSIIEALLVEDNPGDAMLTRVLLDEVAFVRIALTEANSLAGGLARLAEREYHVVLLDLSLPDAAGLEGVQIIQDRYGDLPIVVLTGVDDPELATRAVQSGAQDFLVKGSGDGELMARAIRYAIERKRSQTMLLREKERAEYANRSKSEFLANISHELRTPLNAIIGFSELMRDEVKGPLGMPCYREYATDIVESGTHLLNIINDLLDISKIEAGKATLHEETVNLANVFRTCLNLISERAIENSVTVRLEAGAEAPPRLRADSRKLKQILLNLLWNAIKFTPRGGRVTLAVETLPDGRLAISVTDTGIGIAAEDIPRALSPFTQLDNHLTRSHKGTGLGLPFAKSLIELHGGELMLSSEPGKGTTVSLYFPADRVALRAA